MKYSSIYIEDLDDQKLKDIFRKLFQRLDDNIFLQGTWDSVQIDATSGIKTYVSHTLKIKPVDVIVIRQPAGATIAYNTADFTTSLFAFTPNTTGTYKFLIGKAG